QAESIRRAGEHLLRSVGDALDLARVEAGRLELQRVEFGLDASIDEIAGLMSPLAARKGLRFSVERDQETPERWVGDPLRLKQIVLNLLGNAVKFTERGSVGLRVAATERSLESSAADDSADARTGLRIEVWDTGPGMNEEQVSRLFRRFEQAEGARTTARYGGTGLGLAISRELAVAMDGDIQVRSVPGEGTTFVLNLPLRAADARDTEVSNPTVATSVPTPIAWCVVLLVEDDPTVAEVLIGLLQGNGHRVVHAAHGLAAMTEAAVGRFDAAFVDLDLPGIDGCALAEQLRASGFAAPMIAITARADAQAESQASAAGFVGFLRKPTTGERLEMALRRALAAVAAEPPEATT
ncbi:MAG: response regulator, partial [Xanthomonadaceae bacterium]|nr:response regulator [Xanthomonadaceae bacterium]